MPVRRILVIFLLTLVGAALLAPASAQAQSQEDVECFVDGILLTDPGGSLAAILANPGTSEAELEKALDDRIREIEDCIGNFFPGMDRDFCDDCDPTFDFEEIRQVIIRFDRGRALRQRLLECRDRRLNKTQSDDSAARLPGPRGRVRALRERRGLARGPPALRRPPDRQRPRSRAADPPIPPPRAGAWPFRARVAAAHPPRPAVHVPSARGRALPRRGARPAACIIARGARSVPAGATATLKLRPTRRGNALIARRGRVRAKVIARVPGAFTVRTVTLTR
ncbi:MAG: hypothetical protein WKF31_05970 [Thermoleophilaceae bacterium]